MAAPTFIDDAFYTKRIVKARASTTPYGILIDIKDHARATGDTALIEWIERRVQVADGANIRSEPFGRAMYEAAELFNSRMLAHEQDRAAAHEEKVRASIERAKAEHSADKGSISVTGGDTEWVKRITGTGGGRGAHRYEGVFEKFNKGKYTRTDIKAPYGTVFIVSSVSGKKKRHTAYVLSPLGAHTITSSDTEYWADDMLSAIQKWLPSHRRHYTFDLDRDMGY